MEVEIEMAVGVFCEILIGFLLHGGERSCVRFDGEVLGF